MTINKEAMTKDINDYLHLYLGRECIITPHNDGIPYVPDTLTAYTLTQLHRWSVKPILRPLSDMTDDEIKELIKLDKLNREYSNVSFRKVIGYKNIACAIEIDYTIAEEDLVSPQTWRLDFAAMNAHDFAWCLRKGFDLFGLIDAGIAIDKTKV